MNQYKTFSSMYTPYLMHPLKAAGRSVHDIFLLFSVPRKKNPASAAVMRKTEATDMPESNLVNRK